MNLPVTAKQADLLWRLLDSYIDAAAETQENRSDLAMAKRIRTNINRANIERARKDLDA